MYVFGGGRLHAELVARDCDDPSRILQHADLDLEVAPLLGQLAEGAFFLAERDGHLDALGVNRHVRGRTQGHAQHDQPDETSSEPPPPIARVDDGGGAAVGQCRAHDGSLSAARSLAERERGLRPRSSSPATTTCLVRRRKLGPPAASGSPGRGSALDHPILERVEADDHQPAARPQAVGQLGQQALELAQLVVDGDAQGLEGARGWIPVALAARHRARRPAPARADVVAELAPVASRDDGGGDLACEALLAKVAQDAFQLGGIGPAQEIGRGLALRRVHAHVERARSPKGEAALGSIELQGGYPEVDQAAVDGKGGRFFQHGAQRAEAGVHETYPVAELGQPVRRPGQGFGIALDADQSPRGRRASQDGRGMSPKTHRGVAVDTTRFGREEGHRFI